LALEERKAREKKALLHQKDMELARKLAEEETRKEKSRPIFLDVYNATSTSLSSSSFSPSFSPSISPSISSSSTSLSLTIACPICLEPIKATKTLACSHQFCGGCIFNWTNSYASQCPVCQMEIKDIEGFPVLPRKQRVVYDDEISMRPMENVIEIPPGTTKVSITVLDERKPFKQSSQSSQSPSIQPRPSAPPGSPTPLSPPPQPYAPSLPPQGVTFVNPPRGVTLPAGCLLTADGQVLDSNQNYKTVGQLRKKK